MSGVLLACLLLAERVCLRRVLVQHTYGLSPLGVVFIVAAVDPRRRLSNMVKVMFHRSIFVLVPWVLFCCRA